MMRATGAKPAPIEPDLDDAYLCTSDVIRRRGRPRRDA
jgi:hypothetical protein